MSTEHWATFKFGANTTGLIEGVMDICPPLEDVSAIMFTGYKLRATSAPQEIKITVSALAGNTVTGYYGSVGNLGSPTGTVPASAVNNGILLTPLALIGGATDQDDNGKYSNDPQTIIRDCKSVTRLLISVSDFQGTGTLSQWSGHLYLTFKFIRRAPGFFSPGKRTKWQSKLRDAYVEQGDGF